MKRTIKVARDEVRLLPGLTVRLGDLSEIVFHPSGERFDGPARIVGAYTASVFDGFSGTNRMPSRFTIPCEPANP